MGERVYTVWSTYKITGVAEVVAKSAAEAKRIAIDGYPSGHYVQFDFSEAHHETRMQAEIAPEGATASEAKNLRGDRIYPKVSQEGQVDR